MLLQEKGRLRPPFFLPFPPVPCNKATTVLPDDMMTGYAVVPGLTVSRQA